MKEFKDRLKMLGMLYDAGSLGLYRSPSRRVAADLAISTGVYLMVHEAFGLSRSVGLAVMTLFLVTPALYGWALFKKWQLSQG